MKIITILEESDLNKDFNSENPLHYILKERAGPEHIEAWSHIVLLPDGTCVKNRHSPNLRGEKFCIEKIDSLFSYSIGPIFDQKESTVEPLTNRA